jgi:hypothetical protein
MVRTRPYSPPSGKTSLKKTDYQINVSIQIERIKNAKSAWIDH